MVRLLEPSEEGVGLPIRTLGFTFCRKYTVYIWLTTGVEVNTCLDSIILSIVQEHELEQAICRGHISNRNKKRAYEVLNLF